MSALAANDDSLTVLMSTAKTITVEKLSALCSSRDSRIHFDVDLIDAYRAEARRKKAEEWSISQTNFSRLERHTVFSREDLQRFQSTFHSFIATNQRDGITLSQFIRVIKLSAPHMDESLLERFFCIYDSDRSGRVDFKELMCCMSVLCDESSSQDKITLCFQSFDVNNSGYLDRSEVDAMVASLRDMISISGDSPYNDGGASYLMEVFGKMNSNKDGQLSLDEFSAKIRCEPRILDLFRSRSFGELWDANMEV